MFYFTIINAVNFSHVTSTGSTSSNNISAKKRKVLQVLGCIKYALNGDCQSAKQPLAHTSVCRKILELGALWYSVDAAPVCIE